MFLLDENQLKMMHKLMRERGITKVEVNMFNEEQKKRIYESYGEQFLVYNGVWFMVNCVTSYALAKNIDMVNQKLKQELDYALKQYDYDYAFLCARLMQDETITEFLKQYSITVKYEKIFSELNKIISEAKPQK